MDLGTFFNTVEQLVRKQKVTGDILLVNAMGAERFITKAKLRRCSFRRELRGFL